MGIGIILSSYSTHMQSLNFRYTVLPGIAIIAYHLTKKR